VIDPAALQMVLIVVTGWLERRERATIGYLIEENRLIASGTIRVSIIDSSRARR
jgi:hypothetical protein